MLEARKSRIFESIFAIYNRNLFRRRFNSLQVRGLPALKEAGRISPVVCYANHSSWWDGLVAFEVTRAAGLSGYLMMEEKQLVRLQPFRLLGAFSVDRRNPRSALRSVEYAAGLLHGNPRTAVWIFPQGEILPNGVRPLGFSGGVAKLLSKAAPCAAVPVAMRFEFRGEFKPDIFVDIGTPVHCDGLGRLSGRETTDRFSDRLAENLDELRSDIIHGRLERFLNLL